MPILMDKAAMREPTKKMKFASRMTGLRPQMSLILPQKRVEAAVASR